jgi:hypothetical protein
MSAANMTNSKNATLSMFQNFDYHYQSVGLGVTPPVQPANPCQSIKYWSDPNTWVPEPLTAAYETAPHVLDNSSPPVSDTNCLDITNWPGGYFQYTPGHTNLGDPLKAAKQELVAHGRANAAWGLILIADGAASRGSAGAVAAIFRRESAAGRESSTGHLDRRQAARLRSRRCAGAAAAATRRAERQQARHSRRLRASSFQQTNHYPLDERALGLEVLLHQFARNCVLLRDLLEHVRARLGDAV